MKRNCAAFRSLVYYQPARESCWRFGFGGIVQATPPPTLYQSGVDVGCSPPKPFAPSAFHAGLFFNALAQRIDPSPHRRAPGTRPSPPPPPLPPTPLCAPLQSDHTRRHNLFQN